MSSWIPSLFHPNHSCDPDSNYDNPTSPTCSSPITAASTVKVDLSGVCRGVAAFIAPREGSPSSVVSSRSVDAIAGIKNDLAEIRGSFKSGLALISSKLTSNFFHLKGQLDDEDYGEEEDAVGITEEVVDFARKLSTRPELWVDFPVSLADDFHMSDYQRDHAADIDYLVPELATLRRKISSQISERKFWIIYFILLFPRLSEEDLKFLSSPQVIEAREAILKKLQNRSNTMQETSENHSKNSETNHGIDKGHISEGGKSYMQHTISFSDLEDDYYCLSEKILGSRLSNSDKGEANEWIQLNENSGDQASKKKAGQSSLPDKESGSEDSNDWLAVDENDFDNLGVI
ncbi:uncharacterized protein [Henckelia pumila]|uniref:uncharacterized protein n=1 Tax=Henckelia pumila TaxID=405737 RepID=UPI003C6DD14A